MATKYLVQHRRGTSAQWAEKNTIIPKAGEIVIEIDEENYLHKLKIGDGIHTYAELAYLQAGDEIVTQVLAEAKPRIVTVELTLDWNQDIEGKYSQILTLDNITKQSRLDLQPDADMIAEFKQLGLVFVTENNDGVITVYSVGNMPLKQYTIQATIVETECDGEGGPIIGVPIGIPTAQNIYDGIGEQSIQVQSGNAMGDYSVSLGYNTIAGIKGFYIKAIDATNKHIYLQMEEYNLTEKPVFLSPENIGSEPNADYFDNSFTGYDNIDFESGEEYYCCIKNHFYYTYKCKIVGVNKNCLTYEGELGFTEFYDSTSSVNYSLWIPKYSPEQGAFIIGAASHTEGYETIATHDYSHAEGWASIAAGRFGHAEGNRTVAGASSHAEGQRTKALGENCHAEGSQTTAYANMSHAEGYLTNANGGCSHAEGKQTTTENDASHAEGNGTKALGYQSHAEGYQTIASGNSSHAEGSNTQATSGNSHAEGRSTVASGIAAHAEGDNTTAKGNYSHVEGQGSHANGEGAHAEGLATIANGKYSHTEGYNTTADKDYSHAEGYQTIASGDNSHSEGKLSTASGNNAHAEGMSTVASAECAHAEGIATTASGYRAHAEGYKTIASGRESHAEGYLTVAQSGYQHVQGKCNIIDKNNKYAHIVGNGNSDTDRKNAHTIDWSGNAWFAGDVKVGANNEVLTTVNVVNNLINTAIGEALEGDY